MYKLPYFTEPDEEKVFGLIQETTFSLVTGIYKNFPVATHVPLEIKKHNGKIVFTGHMMKETDHYKAFSENENVLVIFSGPHCYVSASWYVKKNVASTWNYMDVHAKGKIKFTDNNGTKKIIEDITNIYESAESEAAFDKLPKEYVERLSNAIAGFSIEVESIDNVFKLSQNHDNITRKQIIENLLKTNDYFAHEIANEMEKRLDKIEE
ncbi:MAG: FMN-binding negative transcriptional regulator [Bacteroidota bacterium]|nr:FMN-binding negative transcriptional regulator [Bacteroidota bacterium]